MIRARCLATRLGLDMRAEILAAARALKLVFADASALWLSKQGAALGSAAVPISAAIRFAQAYAEENNWAVLSSRRDWPFPYPEREGDWIMAPESNIPALRALVIKRSSVRFLPSMGEPEGKSVAALKKFYFGSAPQTISSLPSVGPSQKRRFVLITRYCLKHDPDGLDEQINFIERLKSRGDCDGVLGLGFVKDTLRRYSFDTFLQKLHKYRTPWPFLSRIPMSPAFQAPEP